MSATKPTEDAMNDVMYACVDEIADGMSKYPDLTYEHGVEAALRWVLGEGSNPMED